MSEPYVNVPLAEANEICSNASESTSPPDVRVAVVITFTFINPTILLSPAV
jgi:hypothetical protein